MLDHEALTRRLAETIVGVGANVQRDQVVVVASTIGEEELTRAVARAAYARGARWVDVLWSDRWVKRARLDAAAEESLDFVPPWMTERLEWLSREHGARISLSGPTQWEALLGADTARAGRDLLPALPNTVKIINDRTTNWCVAPAPTRDWARLAHPDLPSDAAYDRLWQEIAHACRIDEDDPAEALRSRSDELRAAADRLTARGFDALRFRGPGTDFTVGLFMSSEWHGGSSRTVDDVVHHSNIPTEEVYTAPDPARADGFVTATRPLALHGALIEGIRVEFTAGRAVRIEAEKGQEVLRSATSKDESASRLGEVALVDGSGRVGRLGTVFWDTLLDENAASHIALGSAYLHTVRDPAERARANRSQIHVDFMIGGPEVDVDGVTSGGEHVPVLRGGAWQL